MENQMDERYFWVKLGKGADWSVVEFDSWRNVYWIPGNEIEIEANEIFKIGPEIFPPKAP